MTWLRKNLIRCMGTFGLAVGLLVLPSVQNVRAAEDEQKQESQTSQCDRIAAIVNQTQDFMQAFEAEISAFSDNAAAVQNLDDINAAARDYIEAVDRVVDNLDNLVIDLNAVKVRDESLVDFKDQYAEVVRGFSTALQAASAAMDLVATTTTEAELPARIEQSQAETMTAVQSIENLSQEESVLINQVNTYCGVDNS